MSFILPALGRTRKKGERRWKGRHLREEDRPVERGNRAVTAQHKENNIAEHVWQSTVFFLSFVSAWTQLVCSVEKIAEAVTEYRS